MTENPYQPPQLPTTPPLLPPVEKSPWNAWWTLLWAVVLLAIWQTVMTIGLFIAALHSEIGIDGDVIGLTAFATLFFVCPACWLIGQVRPGYSGFGYLGNDRTKWWHWPAWGAATIGCSVIFTLIAPSLGIDGPDDSVIQMARTTNVPLFLYLGVGIGAPLVEEFIFRGALWRGWRLSRLGLWGTLLITSFLWAILHVQYPAAIIAYIFCLGLLLGFAREKSGNLWIPVWMHALNNGLATIEMLRL